MHKTLKHLGTCIGALRKVPISARLAKLSDVFELASLGCFVASIWSWDWHLGLLSLAVTLYYLGWVTHEPS